MENLKREEWRPVPGYEGYYEVSSLGRVKSLEREIPHPTSGVIRIKEKIRTAIPEKQFGYLYLSLHKGGERERFAVHYLVLRAFVGPRPEGMQACHNDGNNTNNRVENLRWGTPKENVADIKRHGRNYWLNRSTCVNGHLYTEDTVSYEPANPSVRVCRVCRREKDRRKYWSTKADKHPNTLNRDKTHCASGHEYIPENTSLGRGGKKRICKACKSARERIKRNELDEAMFQPLSDLFFVHNRDGLGWVKKWQIEDLVESTRNQFSTP